MDTKNRNVILLLVLVFGFIASQNLWRLELLLNPLDAEVEPGDVSLYVTAWCNYCDRARRYLDDAGVPYAEHDIEKSPAARQAFAELGGQGVPLIRVGDDVLHGFAPAALRRALSDVEARRGKQDAD